MSNKIITLEHLQTNNEKTKDWVSNNYVDLINPQKITGQKTFQDQGSDIPVKFVNHHDNGISILANDLGGGFITKSYSGEFTLHLPENENGTLATQNWVEGIIAGKVDYLGIVGSIDDLTSKLEDASFTPTAGDYCRANNTFNLIDDISDDGKGEEIHPGDILVYTGASGVIADATRWDIIHTEDPGNYVTLNTDQTISGYKKFNGNVGITHENGVYTANYGYHGIIQDKGDDGSSSYLFPNKSGTLLLNTDLADGTIRNITFKDDSTSNLKLGVTQYSLDDSSYEQAAILTPYGLQIQGQNGFWDYNGDRFAYFTYDLSSRYTILLPNVSGTLATQGWVGKRFLGTITKEDDFTNIVEEKNAKTGDYVIVETEFFGGPPVGGTNLPVGSVIIYSEDGPPTVIKSNDLLSENNTWTGTNNWTGESSFNAVLKIKDFINPSTHIEFYANGDIIKRDTINNIPSEFRIHLPNKSGTLMVDAAPAIYSPDSKIENAVIFENVKTKLKIGHLYKVIASHKNGDSVDFRTTFDFIYSGNDTGIVDKVPQVFTYIGSIMDPSNNSIDKTFYPNGLIWVEFITGENGSNNQRLYVKFNLGDRVVVPMALDVTLVEVR